RVDLFESDEPHGFTGPRRVASARWLRRWLLHQDDALTEQETSIATDSELQCTRSGQVLGELKGVSVFDLNAERAREWEPSRAAFRRSTTGERRARIRELLGLGGWSP